MNRNPQVQACSCCGARDFTEKKILWPELVQHWELAADEVAYIDRQQGLACRKCGSSLRSMALGLAICRCYGYKGTFAQFVRDRHHRDTRVLEVNEAGELTQFLSKMRFHMLASYPRVDMRRMPYPDRSFDLVVHSDTLEHVPGPVTALEECYRVLAPGGYCIYTIPVIVGRMTRNRDGLSTSYHGKPGENNPDFAVQTEYGCDAWQQLIYAGFRECRLIAAEYPSALALVGVRWDD